MKSIAKKTEEPPSYSDLNAWRQIAASDGLRRLGSVRTSIVAASEPLAATALAVAFLNEPLRAGTVAGGVLILGGAVAASLARGGGRGEAPEVP